MLQLMLAHEAIIALLLAIYNSYTQKSKFCTKEKYLCNIVQRVGNYLDQKEIMLHNKNYTLKQIDILPLF